MFQALRSTFVAAAIGVLLPASAFAAPGGDASGPSAAAPGNSVMVSRYGGNLVAADAYAAAKDVQLDVDTPFTLTGNTTLLSRDIVFSGTGAIDLNGHALTMNAALSAPIRQIFKLNGAGAVRGNIQTPVFWMAWFGAPGDRTVTDETAAIQAAISTAGQSNAANANGFRNVGCNAGSHPVSSVSLVGYSGLHFVTNGPCYLLGEQTGGTAIINVDGGPSPVFTRRMMFDENIFVVADTGKSYAYGLLMNGAIDWTIRKLSLSGKFTVACISIDNSWEDLFENMFFGGTDISASGLLLGTNAGSANALTFIGGRLTGPTGSTGNGVVLAGVNSISFVNPDLSNWKDAVVLRSNPHGGATFQNLYSEDNSEAIIHYTHTFSGLNLAGGHYELAANGSGILVDAGFVAEGLSATGIHFDAERHPIVNQKSINIAAGGHIYNSLIAGNIMDAPNSFGGTTPIFSSIVQDADAAGTVRIGSAVTFQSYKVARLPAASMVGAGALAWITDNNAACAYGGTPAGGGSTGCLVASNGTAWVIH